MSGSVELTKRGFLTSSKNDIGQNDMQLKGEGLTAKRDGYQTPDNGQGYWSSKGRTQRLKKKYTHSDSLAKKKKKNLI